MKKVAHIHHATGLASLIALLAPAVALAGGIDAGTLIQNTAQASYETADGTKTIDSNTVTVKVDELLDVTAASLDAGAIATTPGSEVLTFEITNTGNGPEAYLLTANPTVPGNDFDTVVDAIAIDTNNNGVYDAGVDQILTGPETTPSLDPDEALTVFVLVTVPATAADTDASEVTLAAAAVTGTGTPGTTFAGAGENGSDAVVGSNSAQASANGSLLVGITTVSLVKSAVISDPFGGNAPVPGATITYTISAIVAGSGSVDNLVVTDAFPTGTTYVASSLALAGASLTDAPADDAGEASATGISVDLGTVAGGTTQDITFDVTIDQ
jgi:uncharacterized repeat protein (TIGR01451 family)